MLSVKVYLTSVFIQEKDNNGISTTTEVKNFDVNKIKVSVKFPPKKLQHVSIKLKRLTSAEIAQYTGQQIITSNEKNVDKSKGFPSQSVVKPNNKEKVVQTINTLQKTAKRKNDDQLNGYNLRSKKPKLNEVVNNHEEILATTCEQPKMTTCEQRKIATCSSSDNGKIVYKPVTTIAAPGFAIGEIVWGRIKGWPHWPGKVKRIESNRFEIIWFNDYRTSKLSKNQIFKFHSNFTEFTQEAHLKVGLSTAVKEALLSIASKTRRNE